MDSTILIGLLTMGGLGLFFAAVLAVASEKLKVQEDPQVEKINEALPGLNCGACGYTGCHDLAEKFAKQKTLDNLRCPLGGAETEEAIAKILGIELGKIVRIRAIVNCGGGKSQAGDRAVYQGAQTCAAADLVAGGPKACTYGCTGFGDCVTVCPFDAIHMGPENLPIVDGPKCTACGLCVEACPRKIIDLVSCDNRIVVNCNSHDKGAVVRKVCKVGCIACNICVKQVPEGYKIENFLAKVNYDKGDAAAEPAIAKCPTKCIVKL
ncbi:RnfABCDGE type electron transport complex subunit B [Candidatus Margulisiibacteriota bacterium]